jgi:adenosine deaminase
MMSVASYIEAMPKVELNLYLEGAMSRTILAMISDQNEIALSVKHFQDWLNQVSKPDYKKLPDLIRMTCGWLQTTDDITRVVYEVAVALHKQHVRYAEISVNPILYTGLSLSLDEFLTAINDGSDRAKRAWGIDISWILTVPREEPRRADEIARMLTNTNTRRYNVAAIGLSGAEIAQPVGQFERAFKSVEKRGTPRVVRAGDHAGAEGVAKAIEVLSPNRLVDARGVTEDPALMAALAESRTPVCVSMTRALKQGWITAAAEYPLRKLYDDDVVVVIGSDMPTYYGSITQEYRSAVEQGGLTLEELEEVALNAVRASFLPESEKAAMEAEFKQAYTRLRIEHVPQPA